NPGIDAIQKATDSSGRIVWGVGIRYPVTEHLAGLGQPGVSHRRHQNSGTKIPGEQAPDQRACRNGFTHRHGVYPDNRARNFRHPTQTVLPVAPKGGRFTPLPPQPDQYERQHKANQLGIDKLEHAGLPAKQCVIIGPIFLWTGILPPGKPFVDAGFTILKKKYRKLPRNTDYSAYRHPRWWPTWLGIAAMWLVAQLPLRLQWWLG